MFFVPMGIFVGAPHPLTVGYYIWKSMIPSLIGNILGGVLFTGSLFWYLHLTGTGVDGVRIHFDPVGSPEIVDGQPQAHRVPDSTSNAHSGIAKDLAKQERQYSDSTEA